MQTFSYYCQITVSLSFLFNLQFGLNKFSQEEEKGIDMSDDFGGKLQDIDEKENEDNSGESDADDDEPDKEMGETEEGAETLDEKVGHSLI